MITNDPVADFDRHDAEQSEWLEKRPKCAECGHPIQEECAVCINGDYYHDDCINRLRVWIGDE